MRAVFIHGSLMFIISVGRLKAYEESIFKNGKLEYGVTVQECVPFVIASLNGFFTFDCTINMLGQPQETRDAFLARAPDSTTVQLYLIEYRTGLLRGIRTFDAASEFLTTIKEACFQQLARYRAPEAVTEITNRIIAKYHIDVLMDRTKMFHHFPE